MSNSKHDENSRTTLIATSMVDGSSIVQAVADSTTHKLLIHSAVGGADMGNNQGNAMLDENSVPVATAESSAGDGSIVEVYADASDKFVRVTNNSSFANTIIKDGITTSLAIGASLTWTYITTLTFTYDTLAGYSIPVTVNDGLSHIYTIFDSITVPGTVSIRGVVYSSLPGAILTSK